MIFYDFIVNSMGGISSPEPVAFIWKPEIMQMYFAHSYQHYFEEAGFKLVETGSGDEIPPMELTMKS